MPVKTSYADRVFTTEMVYYPEMVHILENDGYEKDFIPVIEKSLELGGYAEHQIKYGKWWNRSNDWIWPWDCLFCGRQGN